MSLFPLVKYAIDQSQIFIIQSFCKWKILEHLTRYARFGQREGRRVSRRVEGREQRVRGPDLCIQGKKALKGPLYKPSGNGQRSPALSLIFPHFLHPAGGKNHHHSSSHSTPSRSSKVLPKRPLIVSQYRTSLSLPWSELHPRTP